MENERSAALREELDQLVAVADLPSPLHALVREALAAPGKLLATPPGSRWPDLVLDCCLTAGGDWHRAVPAALAAELFGLALDLLDEIEDDDPSPLRDLYGAALTLNCSTALLGLSQMAVSRLAERGASGATVARCQGALARALTTATGGQHLDLASENGPLLTQQAIGDIVARKSGALVGGCCALGAAAGGAEESTLDLYRAFGVHVGVAAQIDNDMHDLWDEVSQQEAAKSDLRRHKQTVPLAFLRSTRPVPATEPDPELAGDLWATGALPYAWTLVQVHRAEAAELLQRIEGCSPRPAEVARLMPLLGGATGGGQATGAGRAADGHV